MVIDRLLQLERRPLDRVLAAQRFEEARRDALAAVRSRLQNLAAAVASLRDAATWADVQTVQSSDTSKVTAVRTGGAAPGAYTVSVSALASADQIRQGSGGGTQAPVAGTIEIAVDGVSASVDVAAGDDLDAIAAKINGAPGVPVYATVVSGRLYLSGKETGAAKTISVASGAVADALALSDAMRAASDHTIQARDASLTVNGASFTSASNTVTTAIPGITLTLTSTVSDLTPLTVTVGAPGPDRAAVKARVQAFVDQYNAAVTFIRDKLAERRPASPQTASDQTEGVLAADGGLSSLLSRLRQAVADLVSPAPGSGSFASLAEVGLSTGSASGSGPLSSDAVAGRLVLDTVRLDEALDSAFTDVKALFTNATGSYESEGVSQRLDAILAPWIKGDESSQPILQARIDGEQVAIDALTRRRAELERRLDERERMLRAQFAALEAVLQQAQSQGAWLSAQLTRLAGARS